MHRKFFFQQNDTKINNFDEGVLILEPLFWGNVIFKICFCSSKLWLRSGGISLSSFPWNVTLQSYVMNGSLYSCCLHFSKQEQTLYSGEPNNRIKMPWSNLVTLVSFCWEERYALMHTTFSIVFLVFLKLLIVSVAFFLGHPVMYSRPTPYEVYEK